MAKPEKCTAVGTWEAEGGGKGNIRWEIVRTWNDGMVNNAVGFKLKSAGNNKDEFGTFRISGECSEMICNFNQNYTSGQFKGKRYEYITGYKTLIPFKSSKGDFTGDDSNGKFQITSMSCK